MKKTLLIIYLFLSSCFFVYLIWPPEPYDIESFTALPNSARSSLSGDTREVANLKAYYSNNYRAVATQYYYDEFKKFHRLPFSPLKINLPPENAFVVIKDQTQSTYLEEYTYPFRGVLYVNGLEPFDENTKKPRFSAATYFTENGKNYETKVVIRYYPTSIRNRIITFVLINMSLISVYLALKIAIKKYE